MITNIISENTDELIAIAIVSGYIVAWFLKNPMPTEPLMIILGYYFGKKVSNAAGN